MKEYVEAMDIFSSMQCEGLMCILMDISFKEGASVALHVSQSYSNLKVGVRAKLFEVMPRNG